MVRTRNVKDIPRFFVGNVTPGASISIDMEYRIIPKVNQQEILDTLTINDELLINMPTETTPFTPVEKDILAANGVSTFTALGVSDVTKLVYPVHANSLQDIFFFPNLKTLDLTGGKIFEIPTLTYDRNGVVDEVGGGSYSSALDKHNRVIVLNIGGEPGISNWDPPKEIQYYFANIRFSKIEP